MKSGRLFARIELRMIAAMLVPLLLFVSLGNTAAMSADRMICCDGSHVAARDSVAKWSICEIPLTANKSYRNPYTQVNVAATFTGPQGITKTVKGFWVGGKTFRIRFAPTAIGAWSYATSCPDPGLNGHSGTIDCVPPAAGNHGFLRRDPDHPCHFVWDDGTHCFMWGQTHYDLLRNAIAGDNWKAAVDNAQRYGMNKIRFRVYPKSEDSPTYPDSQPFAGSTTSPDHDVLNLPHWQKLDEVIRYMDSKGIVANLIFFSKFKRMFGTQAQDERYVRYILARLAAYRNVIWCLCNEWNYTPKPQSYFDAIGGIVRDEDPWMSERAFLRPLSVHQQTCLEFQFFGSRWPVHAIIQYGVRNGQRPTDPPPTDKGDEWGNAGIVYNLGHTMPVVNDEYGYIGEPNDESAGGHIALTREKHRNIIWGIAVAGGYGSAGDQRALPNGNKPYLAGDWKDEPEYGDIQRLVDFFTTNGLEYWKMSSHNSLVTSGTRVHVLAETGRQYVIYAAIGGTFSVNIASGIYAVRRYNPRTGEDVTLLDVAGGGSRAFTAPEGDDTVVYLRKAAQ